MQRHIFFVLTDGGVLISCRSPFLLYFWCQWSPMIRAISAHYKLCHDDCPSWRKGVGPVDGGKVVPKIGEGFPIIWANDQCRVELWDRKGQRQFVLLRQVSVTTWATAAEWNLSHAVSCLRKGLPTWICSMLEQRDLGWYKKGPSGSMGSDSDTCALVCWRKGFSVL